MSPENKNGSIAALKEEFSALIGDSRAEQFLQRFKGISREIPVRYGIFGQDEGRRVVFAVGKIGSGQEIVYCFGSESCIVSKGKERIREFFYG